MQIKKNKNTSCKDTAKKEPPSGPEFESGVIVKISYNQPLPSKRCIKDSLSEMSAVAYVDILDGDKEGYIHFKSPEDAQTVITAPHKTQTKIQAWSSLVFHCHHSSFYPSEAPPWDSRPVSGAGVVHYHLLHRPRSVPTALGPAPHVTVIFSIFRFFCTLRFQILKYFPIITNHTSMEILFIQLSDDI